MVCQEDVREIVLLVVVSVGHMVLLENWGLRLEPFWALLGLLQDFNRSLLSRE